MKLGVLTSVDVRHRYFARKLHEAFDTTAVLYETTGYAHVDCPADNLSADERRVVAEHFAERVRQEQRFFGSNSEFLDDGPSCRVRHLPPGRLNHPDTADWLADAGADTLAVFGTNLIKPPLLTRFDGRIINLHLGLSPWYRGTATNFYPLLNEEPEYVGATILLLDAGIDSGPILAHARPVITPDDRPHTIGCKAIQAAIDKLIEILPAWHRGQCQPVAQWTDPRARLYLRRDYHPRQVVDFYRKLESGLMHRYVERVREGKTKLPLIDGNASITHPSLLTTGAGTAQQITTR